jgi:hypothetical protein
LEYFEMAITKEDILEAVGAMTVMDLNDLVKAFEEKFGVSAASMAVAALALALPPPLLKSRPNSTSCCWPPATRRLKSSRSSAPLPAWA